ncbi:uncharacterized protein [Pocillopora verrucosa]|uniref:uncharacterized protein isoform X2 n=1 Tax=Pocillopora verrucosa TaxID=203993 RepID=UPI003341B353
MKSNIISPSAASIKQWSKVRVRILTQLQRAPRKRKVEREHACMCPQQKVQIQQQSSSRSWRLSGFTVKKKSSIALASQLCTSVRMALIVLEDCEENNSIVTIKSSKACSEHTPIVFISSGPLSGL